MRISASPNSGHALRKLRSQPCGLFSPPNDPKAAPPPSAAYAARLPSLQLLTLGSWFQAHASDGDQLITHRLRDALSLVDIRVLAQLVVAGLDTISFAERASL